MMASLNLAAISSLVGADYEDGATVPGAMVIDSRRVQAGDLFVALPGEKVDGHEYVEQAAQAGAVAALVQRETTASIPCLRVDDGLRAITIIGAANRSAYGGELLAITGSCGKTTVKNICRSILAACAPTIATAGNYNNEIGVPLTLSRLQEDTRYAVVEMGAAGRGHIAHLCELARPRVSTVLNAMEAHLDGFGSVSDVADIKAEIYDGLDASGIGVVNLDQPFANMWGQRVKASGAALLTCSCEGEADVVAADVRDSGLAGIDFTLKVGSEAVPVHLPLPGLHNLGNAIAAAALATACGVPPTVIAEGIADVTPEPGRLAAQTLADGTVLIDDSYNANPGSVRAAIELLAGTPGRRALLLGEMLELGEDAASYHREMGALAAAKGIDVFWGIGAALEPAVSAFGAGARLFADRDATAGDLPALLENCDLILVKGSRGAAMESLLEALREAAGGTA